MDRVIPKDVVDLIYKESHLDKTKRLNAEYLELLEPIEISSISGNCFIKYKSNYICYNFRVLKCSNYTIHTFRSGKISWQCVVPKRYFYSSGNNELKWIE